MNRHRITTTLALSLIAMLLLAGWIDHTDPFLFTGHHEHHP